MPDPYFSVLHEGDLNVFYSYAHKRDCVYVWHNSIGWQFIGFL